MDLLYDLAEVIVRFMDSGPGLMSALLCLPLVTVPVVLVHELGHAAAARRLLGGQVRVSIGSAGKLAELRLGEVAVSLRALSHPGKAAGVAEFDDSRATARDVLMIALAGPAASLLGTVASAAGLSAVAPSGIVRDLLWIATLVGVFGVLNLVPFTFQDRREGPSIRTDGRLALDALHAARALR